MAKTLRCAIYTRKSSEEGLDQAFNSLHAQREACEAYVLSQTGEGWTALKTLYDDGGYSGGNIDRPALKRLLADIDAGRINIVVVYKVDRLTRSLADFAKIVEAFDARGVSFVSVTQAFNTTTSMGRLTLNVLLSFAQFEREVTGERIRDKIAASKAKGMWMGGPLALGYDRPVDPKTRALVINVAEAQTVRLIFQRYLDLGSVHALRDWLDAEGIRSKAWVTREGRPRGAASFSRGALFHLLKNRLYLGDIVHKGQAHPGSHPAIVEADLFERVQQSLAAQARSHRKRPTRAATMVLKGRIFDADGAPMSPAFTYRRRDRVYRYYVSAPLQQGHRRTPDDEAIRRVPAALIESLVAEAIGRLQPIEPDQSFAAVARVEVHAASVQITVRRDALFRRPADPQSEADVLRSRLASGERVERDETDAKLLRLIFPRRLKVQGGRTSLCHPDGRPVERTSADPVLIRALRNAHAYLAEAGRSPIGRPELAFPEAGLENPYYRALTRLAFLAPDIQVLILEGRQPAGLTLQRVLREPVPLAWEDQRRLCGLAG